LIAVWWVACQNNEKPGLDSEKAAQTNSVASDTEHVQRYGMVIKIKPDKIDKYKKLHAHAWPGVLKQIKESHIRNYSIFLKDDLLFGYFEYTGNDFDADMKKMAQDSVTQEWWKLTDSYQIPLNSRKKGEWWAQMEEVFHYD